MNLKKKNIIISFLCGLGAILMLFIGFFVPTLSSIEVNVSSMELNATTVGIEKKGNDYLITTEEYQCKLFVDSDSILDKENLLNIQSGEKIFFRIVESEENLLDNPKIEQMFVVALRTEGRDIITLESYRRNEEQGLQNIKNISIIVAIVLSFITIANTIIIFKKSKSIKQK